MDSILQKLYHGMIHPEEEYQPTQACKQEREKLSARQIAILEKLRTADHDMHDELQAMFEAENAVDALEMEDTYIQGMSMGAKLVWALLNEGRG